MNSAYHHLLLWAIHKGLYISVWREGIFGLQRSQNVDKLKQSLEWAEESKIVIYERVKTETKISTDFSGWNYEVVGTAWVNCFLEPDGTVYDFEIGLLEDWLLEYERFSANGNQAPIAGGIQNTTSFARTS